MAWTKEQAREWAKKYRESGKVKANQARYLAKPGKRAAKNASGRLRSWHRQGIFITQEKFDEMFARQHGRCAICSRLLELAGTRTHLDHDHGSGRPRGILCLNCNAGVGQLQDDPALLRKAAAYLEAA